MSKTNRLNQPSFVVPFRYFEDAPEALAFVRRSTRAGEAKADGTHALVTFGARVGALVSETPAKDREAAIVGAVLAAGKLRAAGHKGLAGKGRVDMVAWLARGGVPSDTPAMKALVEDVASTRRALRRASTRRQTAKAILAGE